MARCPASLLRERLAHRVNDASDADAAVLDRQLDYDLGDLTSWHYVSAAGTAADALVDALAILEKAG